MSPINKLSPNNKNLTRRYLVWCYKTAKEDLDRIDRYATQKLVDEFLLKQLKKGKDFKKINGAAGYSKLVKEFEKYKDKKFNQHLEKKFTDKSCTQTTTEYRYRTNRLNAIELAIKHFLGSQELRKVISSYEEEMTRRILEAREHT